MSQHVADVNLVSIIMYGCNQSNFVASDIEHSEFSDLVCLRKGLTQSREIRKAICRMIAYQRARGDLASGCFSANSFKRFRVMTCIRGAQRYLKSSCDEKGIQRQGH